MYKSISDGVSKRLRSPSCLLLNVLLQWETENDHVMIFGSFPIRWLFFDTCSFNHNHMMGKMIDDNHVT